MGVTMSEVGERLAAIEADQKNVNKQIDRLVTATEKMAETYAIMAAMQEKTVHFDKSISSLNAKVSQIENNSSKNTVKIASISATFTAAIGFIMWYIKTKIL